MIRKRVRRSLFVVGMAAAMVVGVAVGFWMPTDDEFFELRKNFRIFGAVYEEVVTGYVEPVDPGRLMRVGITAMLTELDPYTSFMDEADNAELDIITKGSYGGVGLNVDHRGDEITVVAPIEGASGYKQGVRAGDVITHVGDQSTADLSLNDVQTLLRGEPGTTVRIKVERQGASAPIPFTLTREQVELHDVTYRGFVDDAGTIGYVKMERFTQTAGPELEAALEDLQGDGALESVILDLRDNPGGLLNAAVEVAELFVPREAVVVSTKGRLSEAENTFRSGRSPLLPRLPLVVLVNEYSASASEIVAGAVQDHDRGVVMGTKTYGKGLVQAIRSLPHNTALKMTTAQYYTPSGRTIQNLEVGAEDSSAVASGAHSHETTRGRTVHDGNGIQPDVQTAAPEPSALEEALQRQAAFFHYANHYAASRDTLASDFSVTDEVLTDFRAWLEREEVRYPLEAERELTDLRTQFEETGYDAVQEEAQALEAAIQAEKEAAFDRHADTLKRRLEREILARYVSETRRTEVMLPHDEPVREAVSLLREEERYDQILTPEDE